MLKKWNYLSLRYSQNNILKYFKGYYPINNS